MFDRLSSRLQSVFRQLRGVGQISEQNVQDALREVRLALLEADVHYATAKEFIARVKAKSLGADVLAGVSPGQQIVKAIHDELVALLGGQQKDFNLTAIPAEVMLLGLHGSGKTTTCGKLARQWKQKGKKVLLVACDIRRPAAVDQLEALARQVGAGLVKPEPGESVPDLGRRAFTFARQNYYDVVLYDTGGRFQIDADLVGELKALREVTQPQNVVLVLDAAIGQESVNVAQTFHAAVGLTGLILTKLDGDARGGAALSVVSVTGCPILRVGVGERPEDLEPFHPDRMASRILGMGDVVSLVEKVQETLDVGEAERMQAKLKTKQGLDLEDFLAQMRQMKKMGSLGKLLEMMPGAGALGADVRSRIEQDSGGQMKKSEAIVLSMTPRERRHPDLLDASRRRRIARGAGVQVSDVNELLRGFRQAQQMAKKMKQMQKRLPRGGLFG
ncbi:MAG: signal recognition particle protein [Kiritimatiellia bacterium]